MPSTYEPIATSSPGTVGQVTFSSIPSTYTDIVIIVSMNPSGVDNFAIRFNNDAGANYSIARLTANGTTSASNAVINSTYPVVTNSTYSGGVLVSFRFNIFNYTGGTNKAFLSSASIDKNGGGEVTHCVGLWRNTTAINRIDLYGSYTNGTTVTLYGIKAA